MKKASSIFLLFMLLLFMITACYQPNNLTQENTLEETNENSASTDDKAIENTANAEQKTTDEDVFWVEYQEKVGCYVTTESSQNLKDYMYKGESQIIVSHEKYGSNTFYITTLGMVANIKQRFHFPKASELLIYILDLQVKKTVI